MAVLLPPHIEDFELEIVKSGMAFTTTSMSLSGPEQPSTVGVTLYVTVPSLVPEFDKVSTIGLELWVLEENPLIVVLLAVANHEYDATAPGLVMLLPNLIEVEEPLQIGV
jgi:hypothetical protein